MAGFPMYYQTKGVQSDAFKNFYFFVKGRKATFRMFKRHFE